VPQLVLEHGLAIAARGVEDDVLAEGVSGGTEAAGRGRRAAVGVEPHAREVVPELQLERDPAP
jgi:hypothetical protein